MAALFLDYCSSSLVMPVCTGGEGEVERCKIQKIGIVAGARPSLYFSYKGLMTNL